ncbi:TetR family transcriptional regulator [Peterkaempfera bronchialis]|uniref:TetR family transcriptional regulator n=1 Tax=Peterkaempfera bronchialis TaxID=2126346 RepID=UPI001E36DA00|nr:TetR family transcriptional regulator [Peterkaempfera bronchialis]
MAQHIAEGAAAPLAARCRITAVCAPTAGLRQRKKQRTRDELVGAAHELFLRQGYGRTTVDEIAAAVDVSQRTFFRYFANKEEVALAVLSDAEDHFIRCLRDRPAEEYPLQALRSAISEAWRSLHATDRGPASVTAALELIQLIESTPVLLAAHLRRTAAQERQVTAIIAEREGVDPAVDLRPRLLAAVFGAVVRTAHEAWGTAEPSTADAGPDSMITVIDRHLDQLGPAITGDWQAATR